jgi:hypothetical protein
MMISLDDIYRKRHLFVKKLEEALLMLDDVRGIEYRVLKSKNAVGLNDELVRIDWHDEDDPHVYLNVTMIPLGAILDEIDSEIRKPTTIGKFAPSEEIEKLWEEADSYEP